MNDLKLTHLYAPKPGGVADYVDIMIENNYQANKLALSVSGKSNLLPEHYLLHYSGYGFAKRGAPLWLLHKIENDRAKFKTFGVFFHELYAFGPPWGSAFWLSPAQRYIAKRLAELSDYWITNREDSAVWLSRFALDKAHKILPVFSNVGEISTYSSKRLPRVVVFGGAPLRAATYRAAGDTLFRWIDVQGLELHDIGPAMNDQTVNDALKKVDAIVHGKLDGVEVSRILAESSFGLVKYPVEYVAKSGVFAAYCAHGVCPILLSEGYAMADGLVAGEHFVAGIPDHSTHLQSISQAAWTWYQPHNISSHISAQQQLLGASNFRDN